MAVTGPELEALRHGQTVGEEAARATTRISGLALVLSDESSATATLRGMILSDMRSLAQLHRLRTQSSAGSGGAAFWFAALAGLALMSMGYLAFPISSRSIFLISLLGA
jgi:hypothetical protein